MNSHMTIRNILEVCAGDIDSVVAAAKGGASRVELCSALGEGGVTPSLGFIRRALEVPGIRVHVLIRPRGGDFLYDKAEVDCMVDDIIAASEAGVHGVVIGALTPEGDIDTAACRRMMEAAAGISVTFHRAFDLCRDPHQALEEIIALGCNRVLTSGQAANALEGKERLAQLVSQADGRIIILAGAGVNPANAAEILSASGTHEIHASARSSVASRMTFRHEGVAMGSPDSDEYSRKVTSPDIVRQIVENITEISK